ncbi:thioesterase II family protein [Streptomyces sp. NBC_01262]|uniref:thioesterase II family protein n=1 Tax=Streptomyces sp. NBC_01262 TaxID=2903803 RepID=UPI002E32D869|nr:thioesterase domain-containing protein [Streptomyces sp. NBC_01262]
MTDTPQFPRWLLRKPSQDATARVFCFPYSGVGASMFNQWPQWIGTAEVCPLQLPARENRVREKHYGTYEALAESLIEPLLPYLDRPFVFFGHCAGSLPAFETALRLADLGLPAPRQLVVSAQVAPHHCPHDRFLDMDEEELGEELSYLVRKRGGTPHPLLIELTLDVLRQDLNANRVYRRDRPAHLPTGITVLHWADDTEVTPAQIQGWRDYSEDVSFPVLDGGHYEFLSAPHPLLELLRSLACGPERTDRRTAGTGQVQGGGN